MNGIIIINRRKNNTQWNQVDQRAPQLHDVQFLLLNIKRIVSTLRKIHRIIIGIKNMIVCKSPLLTEEHCP